MARLTNAYLDRLTLPEGKADAIVWDDDIAGFGVRVRAGGARTWIAQYRMGAKQRRLNLGRYPILGADAARKAARAVLAKAGLGVDAQAEKVDARAKAAVTLGALLPRYLDAVTPGLRARTAYERRRYLATVWRCLHERPVHGIERRTIAAELLTIAKARGPIAANRARMALSALMTWAIKQGLADANPVVGTEPPGVERSRSRVLSDAELRAVWQACRDDDYGRIVQLLILTGQRREEVGAMRWSELDLDVGLWRLPAERTKNGLPHDVPLSDAALAVLTTVPRRAGRDLLFGRGETAFSGWGKAKATLEARAKAALGAALPAWTVHDIRRSVVTGMNELGIQPHVIEAVVNHVSGAAKRGVAGVYNRAAYGREKREALARWGEHVMALIERRPAIVSALRAAG